MRVTSDFFVSALMRRAFSLGGFAAIMRRGAPEAGAILLLLRDRFGDFQLFAPASQSSYDEAKPQDRLFSMVLSSNDPEQIQARIDKEARFDPDIWVIEFELSEQQFTELVAVTTL